MSNEPAIVFARGLRYSIPLNHPFPRNNAVLFKVCALLDQDIEQHFRQRRSREPRAILIPEDVAFLQGSFVVVRAIAKAYHEEVLAKTFPATEGCFVKLTKWDQELPIFSLQHLSEWARLVRSHLNFSQGFPTLPSPSALAVSEPPSPDNYQFGLFRASSSTKRRSTVEKKVVVENKPVAAGLYTWSTDCATAEGRAALLADRDALEKRIRCCPESKLYLPIVNKKDLKANLMYCKSCRQ